MTCPIAWPIKRPKLLNLNAANWIAATVNCWLTLACANGPNERALTAL